MCTTPLEFQSNFCLFPPGGDMWKHIFAHYSISTCGKATKFCVLVHLYKSWVLTLTYFSRSQRTNFKNIHNVIQLRNYCLHLHQLFTLDTSDESMSHAIWVAPIMSLSLLTGWIVSLAQTFLHCDVAEYRICKATFYSTQQWIGPLVYSDWRKNAQAEG
jgi:hypothetical protein